MKQELQADQQSLEVRAASILPFQAVYGQWGLWCTRRSNFIGDYSQCLRLANQLDSLLNVISFGLRPKDCAAAARKYIAFLSLVLV